ncbi:hypothetical protein ABZ772_19765 [Streptomyces griseoincarnatus]
MTPHQVFVIATLGGITGIVGAFLFVALALGIYQIIDRVIEAHNAWQTRRAHTRQQQADLAACQAIHDLPTTDHPKEPS